MLDMDAWLARWRAAVLGEFGPERVRFLGIQGSRARGEAAEGSDIDAVLILDELRTEDLARYREAVSALPERDKLCGFVSGERELRSWPRAELFQFCLDTTPLLGSLDEYAALVSRSDVRESARACLGAAYHSAVHNCLHARSEDVLREAYKSAFFALRALRFLETGRAPRTRRDLADDLGERERDIIFPRREGTLDERSARLIEWASGALTALDGE